ncbi:MAG: hypothetical protein HKN14_02240 [Marinicaulis sp.]|nr:hypothetical protein [Marinicaulis sp.]
MSFSVSKSILAILTAIVSMFAVAFAQEKSGQQYTDVDLGERNAGEQYSIAMAARNVDCDQSIDFKFSSNADWLRFSKDPVIRQVRPGENRTIQATLDFSNLTPGEYEAIVEIDCQNCGGLIFKNCKVNRQKVRLKVKVVGASPVDDIIQHSQLESPKVDYTDKRIPRRLRNAAKRTHGAWAIAVKKANKCAEELVALQAKYENAKANSDALKMSADTADQDVRNMKAQNEAGQTELLNANKAVQAAKEAVKIAERELDNALTHEREAAKTNLAAKQSEKAAADKRLTDAKNGARLHSNRKIRQAEKDAQSKREAAEKAKKAENKALKALNDKRRECGELAAKAEAAKAANAKAESEAKVVLPPAPIKPTQAQVDEEFEKVKTCVRELGELLEAQRLAFEAMARLGMLKGKTESDFKSWADGVDKANDLFSKVPPGIPVVSSMVGTVTDALTFVRAVIGVASAIDRTGSLNYRPVAGMFKDETKAKNWLKSNGFASSDPEAQRVADQMKLYSKSNSSKGMEQALEQKKSECDGKISKYEETKAAFEAK